MLPCFWIRMTFNRILAWEFFFILGYISKTGGFKGQIPIGAIFDERTDTFARTGYQYAISSHSQRNKEDIRFTTVYDEVDINDNFKVASRICLQMAGGVFAFYGKTSMSSFSIIQSFSNTFQMPYISFSLSGATEPQTMPYVIFVKPSYVDVLFDIIKAYRWTQLDYLYDSDDGLMRVQKLQSKLKDTLPQIDMRFRRIDDVSDAHEDLRRLDKNHQHTLRKNIILDLSSFEAYGEILRQIPEVGMNRNGYSYLLGTLDILNFNLTRFRHGGVNITGFQLVNHQNRAVRRFLDGWGNLSSSVWPGAGRHFVQVDAALSVDVVEALFRALKNMVRRNEDVFSYTFRRRAVYNHNKTRGIPCDERPVIPWMHGKAIFDSLKRIKFNGLTGNVEFDSRGRRKNYKLDVFTVSLNSGPQKIGEWDTDSGLKTIYDEGHNTRNKTPPVPPTQKIVTTIVLPPFLMRREQPDNGKPLIGNDAYEGYCKDLAEEVSRTLNFDFIIHEVEDETFGAEQENSTWSGMIGELRRGVADLAIAPLTITAERERVVDFSKPFMDIGISIMIKRPEKQKPGVFAYMEPFSIWLWACICIAYVGVSISVFLVSRFSPYEWRNMTLTFGNLTRNHFTLSNSFWFSMGALMLQGSDHCPRSAAGRIIGGAWWFFVLIIISSYTANLAAFLTIERMLTPIKSADDLSKQTKISYGTLKDGSTREFFQTSQVPTYRTMYNFMTTATPSPFVNTIEAGVKRVTSSKGKYAFLLESTMNEYYNNRKPCNTMQVGQNLNLKGFGIATPLRSHFKEKINYAVLKLKEDGTLHKLKQTWWYEKGECGSDTGYRESKKRSLSLSNVAGIFYILISGLVLAIITGIVEIFFSKKRPLPDTGVGLADDIKRNETRTTVAETPPEQMNGLSTDVRIR